MKTKKSSFLKPAAIKKAAETGQSEEYITLYHGTTTSKAQEYLKETDTSKRSKLIIARNPGQFHMYGAVTYVTRDRELAAYYASAPLKWSPPQPGAILVFKIPAHSLHGALVWKEACNLWNEVCPSFLSFTIWHGSYLLLLL